MKEVAATLRVSLCKAYRLAQSGELPSVRMGGCVKVRHEDLERYVAEHLQGARPSLQVVKLAKASRKGK